MKLVIYGVWGKKIAEYRQNLTEAYIFLDLKLEQLKILQDISMKLTQFSLIFKELSNDTKYIVV